VKYIVELESTLTEVSSHVVETESLEKAVGRAESWKNRAWIRDSYGNLVGTWNGSRWLTGRIE